MLKKSNHTLLIILLFVVSLSVVSTLAIQYWLGHTPCKLCLYERIPYFLSIVLLIQIIFFKKFEKIVLILLSIVFVSSAVLAFYHFGIEQGFFKESLACSTQELSNTLTKEELLEQLKQNNISCKNVDFRILGFSLAAINTIFSIVLSVIFVKLFINYGKN